MGLVRLPGYEISHQCTAESQVFEVTRQWIQAHQSGNGGWNRDQLASLGVKWPPSQGWIGRAVGIEISIQAKLRFEQMRGLTMKQRKTVGQSPQAKLL